MNKTVFNVPEYKINIDVSKFKKSSYIIIDDNISIENLETMENVFRLSKFSDMILWDLDRKVRYQKRMNHWLNEVIYNEPIELNGKDSLNMTLPERTLYENDKIKVLVNPTLVIDEENLKILREMVDGSIKTHEDYKKREPEGMWGTEVARKYIGEYLKEHFSGSS